MKCTLILKQHDSRIDLWIGDELLLRGGMPAVAWRHEGEQAWRWDRASLTFADGSRPECLEGTATLGPVAVRMVASQGDGAVWTFSGDFRNTSDRPIELARLHYLHGSLARDTNLLALNENRFFQRSETLEPHREWIENKWGKAHVVWPRLADPIHDERDWAVATDIAVLTDGWNEPGLVVGFTGPGEAFGEIGMRTIGEPVLYLGARLDNILVQPGERRTLERAIMVWGDWQDGLVRWSETCASELNARPMRPPLVGWCSWYQHWNNVHASHVQQATREFAAWDIPSGGRVIQIDDGFQIMPADWRPNARFRDGWNELPGEIAATGSTPGLWLAPTTIFHTHPIMSEHPDWLQRLPNGELAVSFSNWGWCDHDDYRWGDISSPTWYLDTDHPGAQAFMADIVSSAVQAGWRYLKLDFTYALSTARRAVNRSRTSMQSLREMYRLFREAAGPDAILCACIGEMGRYALGYADTARLGGDIGAHWDSLARNLKEFLPRLCVNGLWWNGDPDVFYMRSEKSQLSLEESWVLTGTIGLIGGVFLTSDFVSQWGEEAARRVRHFWNETGPAIPSSHCATFDAEGRVAALRVSSGSVHRIGLYNWQDEPRAIRVPLPALRLDESVRVKSVFPDDARVRIAGNELVATEQPGHSLRIVEVCG